MVTVHEVDAMSDARWRDLVAGAGGSLFHSPAWSSVLTETYGFEVRALIAVDGDRVCAGIPWCEVSDPGGRRLVSLPFSDFCGPIGRPPFAPLLATLAARGVPAKLRMLVDAATPEPAPDDGTGDGFRTSGVARWHGVAVGRSPDVDGWADLASSTRRAVAKARREGVEVVERTDREFVDRFFRLHAGVRKHKYRLLPQPRAFFTAMRDRFEATGDWHPLVAVRDGEVIAATVYLRCGDTLYYKFNASDPAGLSARPNDLLLWAGIELAARLGCRLLDLGASDDDQPGLIRFKRGFGADEREIRTRVAGPPAPAGAGPFQALLHDVTGKVTAPTAPDALTEAAGARLYRFFA
jgi:CelD/BcsL family acetyltransferase involved in cellulose biosynthesis